MPNMFATLAAKPHSTSKRMISNIYSKSYLHSSFPLAHLSTEILSNRLLPLLDDAATSGEPLEMQGLLHATTMDFVTGYLFGIPQSSNFLRDADYRQYWLSLYQSRHGHLFFGQETPGFTAWMRKIGIRLVPHWVDAANQELEAWCLGLCDAAETAIRNEEGGNMNGEGDPVVYRQVTDSIIKERKRTNPTGETKDTLLDEEKLTVASEMLDHLGLYHCRFLSS